MSNIVPFDAGPVILAQKTKFNDSAVFAQEFEFAMQAIKKSDYLFTTASNNQTSLADAISNVAKIGISLNPALSHAYLIPRKISGRPSIVLDISYRGLCKIAVDSRCVKFVQAHIVRKKDSFKSQGIDKEPIHDYNEFATKEERGEIVGAYCVVKTLNDDYLTEIMNMEELLAIKARSESGKKDKGPWVTDFEPMCKKTVIKRASKLWPIGDGRLYEATETINQHEGINFEKEKEKERMINESELKNLQALCDQVEDGEARVLNFSMHMNKDGIVLTRLQDLTESNYLNALNQLTQKISAQNAKQEKENGHGTN